MSNDGKTPTANKIYYDVFTWVITQLAFSFTVAPFILLSLPASLKVWSRVWFYCIIGVIGCFGFLNSPLKSQIVHLLKKRTGRPAPERSVSHDSTAVGSGIPDDPQKELGELVQEVRAEIEMRKRRGSTNVPDFKVLLNQKINEWKRVGGSVKTE